MRSTTTLLAAGVACAAVAACTPPPVHHVGPGPLKVISRLDCPNEFDDLSLRSQSGDGASCSYQDDAGTSVDLRLIPLNGADPQTVLGPIETALQGELPASVVNAQAAGGGDHVDINLPGVHIHAGDNGAQVTTPTPNDHDKGVVVNANDNGAQVRVQKGGPGVHSEFLLVSDTPGPNGYKFVGYEARGPASGPIAVAEIKGKDEDREDLQHQVDKLLDRNVGR
ncbi:MAG TPA: hypothetical protein VGS12_17760 [Caulobacteraceae bacterium]|nr:hypothetical protein [Caulobacteraceae bacterium]